MTRKLVTDDTALREELLRQLNTDDDNTQDIVLPQYRVQSGGAPGFINPTTGVSIPELEGVIIHVSHPRALWASEEGGNQSPLCASLDGVRGAIGDDKLDAFIEFAASKEQQDKIDPFQETGMACRTCPFNAFGSGKGKGKACKETRRLLMLPKDSASGIPLVISLPPSSIRNWQAFYSSRKEKGLGYASCYVTLTTAKAMAGSNPYSIVALRSGPELPIEVLQQVITLRDQYVASLARQMEADEVSE